MSAWNQFNASVNITAGQNILLDVSPPALNYLNIFGTLYVDNASIQFHQHMKIYLILTDINVSTRFVSVYETGSLIVGTSACPITAKVIFSFYGPRVASSVSDMGADTFDNRIKQSFYSLF